MCGIFGLFGDNLEKYSNDFLTTAAGLISHRGPDHTGLYSSSHFKGASVRLSIIDLSTGNQPITCENNRYTIIFNGEIYNFRELRKTLISKGAVFKTKSDTEVLLRMYIIYKEAMLSKLEGQFAFIIFDSLKEEVFGARDRWGICPFFFTKLKDKTIVFTSEAKSLLSLSDFDFQIDPFVIQQISWCWSNIPPSSIWKNIFELPIGHFLRVSNDNNIHIHRYHNNSDLIQNNPFKNISEALYGIKEILTEETRKHMVSDVPVGAYLSGGIDSSIIVTLASRLLEEKLRTFSVAFEDKEFDESESQNELIAFLNVKHTKLSISGKDIVDNFPRVVFHAEKPLFRNAPVPLFLLSKIVQENGIKVVLTGEGSDELFWGYDTYKEVIIRNLWARNPESKWRPSLLSRMYNYLPQFNDKRAIQFIKLFYKHTISDISNPLFSMLPRFENGWAVSQIINEDYLFDKGLLEETLIKSMPDLSKEKSELKKCQLLELQTLLPGYLLSSQGDRMLMSHSVEGRFPFLGNNLSKTLWNIPDFWKIQGLTEKYLLREAFKGDIPESIRTKQKFPYRAPDLKVFFPHIPDYVHYFFSEEYTDKVGIFSRETVRKIYNKLKNYKQGQIISHIENMSFLIVLSTHLTYYFYTERRSVNSIT